MTPTELMQNAHSLEAQGIPIDWKGVATKIYTAATEHIAALEKGGENAEADNYEAKPDREE